MLRYEDWAQQCCAQRMTMAQDYKTFVASLHAALTQLSISQGANPHRGPDVQLAAPTYYGKRYAMPINRRVQNRRPSTRRTPDQIRQLKASTNCLKCGEQGHWRAECPRRDISMSDAVNARLKSMGTNFSTVQDILIDLVKDDDEYNGYSLPVTQTPEATEFSTEEIGSQSDNNAEAWHSLHIDPIPLEHMLESMDAKFGTDFTENETPAHGENEGCVASPVNLVTIA